jgi:hypothetical protein
MVRLFVRHRVADYPVWRSVYDSFESERPGFGVTGHAVFQAVDDPNDVTVWHDFGTAEEAQAFGSSDRLREVMRDAGVQGAPEVWLTAQT